MTATDDLLGDRYRVGERLGRGGMADVRRARDERLGREVAVKLLPAGGSTDEARRMEAEIRMLARLDHPGLVRVLDTGTQADRPWFAMDLVEGCTLSDLLADGPLAPEQVRRLGQGLAEALAAVHAGGVVHRDLKPSNVLLGDCRVDAVRLTDFGVARVVAEAPVTATGIVLGTASYLAPEQVEGRLVGPAADVYTLGLLLVECLTGRREYQGTGLETAVARLHRSPRVPADLPPRLAHLLRWTTADDPERRPSAEEVSRRLADPRVLDAAAEVPGHRADGRAGAPPGALRDPVRARGVAWDGGPPTAPLRPVRPGAPVPGRTPRPASRGPLPVVAVLLVVVLAALVAVLLVALARTQDDGGPDLGPLEGPVSSLEQEVGL